MPKSRPMTVANAESSRTTALAECRAASLLGVLASSVALAYCKGHDGRFLAANQSLARKLGQLPESLTGREVAEFIHPEDADSGARRSLEQRWLTSHGWRWITWEESPLRDGAGNVSSLLYIGHDTTRKRLVEEQFYKLSRAFDQAPVSMVITDAEGRVQYVNARFTATTGSTLEQILDNGVDVLRAGHSDEVSYATFRESVGAGNEWKGELKRELPDASIVWESVQVSCLRNLDGDVTNLLCLREDITARKELEERLRQAHKMESLGTLAGGIAHDFNNLLAIISGYAELNLLRAHEPEAVKRNTGEIQRATDRAIGLVQQILTFSRKAEVRFSAVDLNALVQEITELMIETFPKNVTLLRELAPGLPPLRADENQLQQIVLNLCVNARDAMPDGGTIAVRSSFATGADAPAGLSRGRSYAYFEVADTGTGMSSEVRARIFEPFYTTKEVNKGTGLGLSVVYGIVASHEGLIEVDSTPGLGSTFRVFIPLADDAAQVPSVETSSEFPGGTESLLIVDDETTLLDLLQVTFTSKGYAVTSADDGIKAISFVRDPAKHFDAVVLDLNIPGATGLEVLNALRVARPGVPALVVTAHLSAGIHAEFERLGFRHFLHKPYSLDQLGHKLRLLIEEA
ncbi:MAG TPA: PAS domain S-box protein [Opitutaceae bacterium]|nr:PAS domain S-box protein [Opitutaceae bacterium]